MAGEPASRHTVLAEADGSAYQSLRQRPVTRGERYALGKSLRKRVPRRTLADWEPPFDRPDPIHQITVSHQGRADRLVPVRVGRMIASPYGFLRGSAVVMAEDVACVDGDPNRRDASGVRGPRRPNRSVRVFGSQARPSTLSRPASGSRWPTAASDGTWRSNQSWNPGRTDKTDSSEVLPWKL